VLADIPGLIEGAHEGAGIGDRFLGHIERCAVLLHLVDATNEDPAASYKTIRRELVAYGNGLESKAELVALTKADALGEDELAKKASALKEVSSTPPLIISGVSGQGVREAMGALYSVIEAHRAKEATEETAEAATGWRP
ncbi:MAG: GTPase, partial [Pseudomonadota bacterium]